MRTPEATEGLVDLYCQKLKLPGVRQIYREAARQALAQGDDPVCFLEACLRHELDQRAQRNLQLRLKQARFPWVKTLADFDFTAIPKLPKARVLALADGRFIRQREVVLMVGQTGTGKTHCAIALGLAAIEAGFRVRFIRVVELVQELLAADKEFRLPAYLKAWQKVDLVILDELGYLGLGPGGPLLFHFCSDRYERGALIVKTNLEFSRWGEVFGDATLTAALLDRLTHRSHVLLFEGESYRFRESRRRHEALQAAAARPPTGDGGQTVIDPGSPN